jgi:hypothetical protein
MIGSLRENWKHTWKAIWSRLDESSKSPDDLFARLYKTARPYLATPLELQREIDILNDRVSPHVVKRRLGDAKIYDPEEGLGVVRVGPGRSTDRRGRNDAESTQQGGKSDDRGASDQRAEPL